VVRHSVRGADVPRDVLAQLAEEVAVWPPEWRDVVRACLTRRLVTGTPIAEYVPDRMVAGRLVLVGDAAHVPTPMTGSGFDAALEDAEALGAALGAAEDSAGIPGALEVYQDERLAEARDLVRGGQGFSRRFGAA
jgi:2-polyprenyl-6-methoxyphenol hydroxylase-like FAD-dependent oxidoreductase